MSNIVFVGGVVKTPVYFDNDILNIDLKIFRQDLNKIEELTVITNDNEAISKAVREIKVGDYFLTTNAFIKTKTYLRTKELDCSECYNSEYQKVKSERTEVMFNSFSILKVEEGQTPFGINKVFLEGNVCNELNYREKDGKSYCKYKLAVNQKVYDKTAEYPFVVTFGKDAELSQKYLKRNSRVFVEGSIQQRIIKQSTHFVCPICGVDAVKKVPHTVREIITSNVLFLDKDKDKEKLKSDDKNTSIVLNA